MRVLPAIFDAVGNSLEVSFDGGVRSGRDVLKMINMGARAVFIGRAFLYGLGALGEEGVLRVLEMFGKELDVAMALTGKTSL